MGRDKRSGVFYDGKAIHTIEAVSYVARSSYSQPFDTALRAYSGHAVDLQEATSAPGIRLVEYCLVINQGACLYGSGEIYSAPRSCCRLPEQTPLNKFLGVRI